MHPLHGRGTLDDRNYHADNKEERPSGPENAKDRFRERNVGISLATLARGPGRTTWMGDNHKHRKMTLIGEVVLKPAERPDAISDPGNRAMDSHDFDGQNRRKSDKTCQICRRRCGWCPCRGRKASASLCSICIHTCSGLSVFPPVFDVSSHLFMLIITSTCYPLRRRSLHRCL